MLFRSEEQTRATEDIAALTATLERVLNRILDPREITETVTVGADGRLNPTRGPVVSLTSATVNDVEYPSTYLPHWASMTWSVGAEVEITYLAGREPDAGIRDTIARAVARAMSMPVQVATGALGSYSVEGTSITYKTDGDDSAGGLLVGELRGLGRLRRPVLL